MKQIEKLTIKIYILSIYLLYGCHPSYRPIVIFQYKWYNLLFDQLLPRISWVPNRKHQHQLNHRIRMHTLQLTESRNHTAATKVPNPLTKSYSNQYIFARNHNFPMYYVKRSKIPRSRNCNRSIINIKGSTHTK